MHAAEQIIPTSPEGTRVLPSPHELRLRNPVPPAARRTVETARTAFRNVLTGNDPRLVVIVGPCSIHAPVDALEYARRLALVAREHRDSLLIAMRTYVEKPRTTVGWKGLIHDPALDGRGDIARGLQTARALMLDVNRLGLPCASELLDPIVARYLDDLIAWGCIGARTAESQTHRELASGFPAPVGVKNATSGDCQPAIDAVQAARAAHTVLSVDAAGRAAEHRTSGNADAHVVLRGGSQGPNCDAETIERVGNAVARTPGERPIMVDCSHGNSKRNGEGDPALQPSVATQLVQTHSPRLAGILIESNLRAGRQPWAPGEPLEPGLSITDACLGWSRTERLLRELAATVRGRGAGAE